MNNVKFNFRDTLIDDADSFRSGIRDIDSSSSNEWTAVIDPNGHGTSICADVCYAQPGAEGQAGVRSPVNSLGSNFSPLAVCCPSE